MNRAIYNIMEGFARLVLKAPKITGAQNVVNDVPAVFVANHAEYTACYYKTVFPFQSFTVGNSQYNGSQIMC